MSADIKKERADFDTRLKIDELITPLEVVLNMEYGQPHIKHDPEKTAEYLKLSEKVQALKDLIISGQLPTKDRLAELVKGIRDFA